jgi:hypothetical protein
MTQHDGDELIGFIRKILNQLLGDGVDQAGEGFSGYAILAGPGNTPTVIRIHPVPRRGLPWEAVEGDDVVYITAPLPPGAGSPPLVTFRPLVVEISLGGETTTVSLPCRIDVESGSWHVKNGILDIVCRKTDPADPNRPV